MKSSIVVGNVLGNISVWLLVRSWKPHPFWSLSEMPKPYVMTTLHALANIRRSTWRSEYLQLALIFVVNKPKQFQVEVEVPASGFTHAKRGPSSQNNQIGQILIICPDDNLSFLWKYTWMIELKLFSKLLVKINFKIKYFDFCVRILLHVKNKSRFATWNCYFPASK